MQSTLRLESLSFGRTRLEAHHCPTHFAPQEIFGINQYVMGDIMLEAQGETGIQVTSGAAILIPAGIPFRFTNHRPGQTISVWHGIHYSIMDTIDPLTLLDVPYFIGREYGMKVVAINGELAALEVLKSGNFLEYIVRRHTLGMRLFELVLSVSTLKPYAHEYYYRNERLQPVLQYIKAHLEQPLSTSELASVLHVSTPRFFEIFRDAQNVSPGQYIQQLRMRKAQELLMNSDLRIHEVATATGYTDQFHFSRLFKKRFRISPDLFRKKWRGP